MNKIKRYAYGVFFISFSIALAFSLLGYNKLDKSFLYDNTNDSLTNNYLGHFGSQLASLFLFLFGSSSILFIFSFLILGLIFFGLLNFKKYFDKALVLIISTLLLSIAANISSFELFSGVYPGGLFGIYLINFLNKYLDFAQIKVFLFLSLIACSIVLFRFKHVILIYYFLNKIPFKRVLFARVLSPISLYILSIKNYLISIYRLILKKYVAADLVNSNKDINEDIFNDPIWQEYLQPAKADNATVVAKAEFTSSSTQMSNKMMASQASDINVLINTSSDLSKAKEGKFLNSSEINEFGMSLNQDKYGKGLQVNSFIYKLPNCQLLTQIAEKIPKAQIQKEGELQAKILENKLEQFNIKGSVIAINHGPSVVLYEYQPAIDTKISNIIARENDLALALQAISLRIIAPIPGRSVVGFEVAKSNRNTIYFAELANCQNYSQFNGLLPLILGKDSLANAIIVDLARLPHLLIAGSTGSGKSVGLHGIIMSLLCSKTYQELRLILIDPKRLEFTQYADVAHLLFPLVTEPTRAIAVLNWVVKTMEERYNIMAQAGVRNLEDYNKIYPEIMPYIVVIIDELADLMMTSGKEVEYLLTRLAQMSRAAGIHLIVATQRPSVDVITGIIKVNFPSRIAFKVTSKVDSRTIIDGMGAEKLLGKGDMLFLDSAGKLQRIQGVYVPDEDIKKIVQFIKSQVNVVYQEFSNTQNANIDSQELDEIHEQVVEFLKTKDEVSISLLQRVFKIGYNRSARLIDQLETQGYILPSDGSKMRKVAK